MALFAINCYALGIAAASIFFKRAMASGATLLDFFLCRNISMLIVTTFFCKMQGIEPLGKDFPRNLKWTILARCFTGQMGFFLFNLCLALIPMTYVIIIFQTSGFWASLLARVLFAEPMTPLDIMGLVICFGCVVTITLAGTKDETSTGEAIQEKDSLSRTAEIFGFVMMIICSWVYAFNCILNRGLKQVPWPIVVFTSGLFGFILGSIILLVEHYFFRPGYTGGIRIFNYDSTQYMYLIGAMFCDTLATSGATVAF